jgi:hypothetical protein
MRRLAKSAVVIIWLAPAMVFAQISQTIYKSVDESGRVTYANSPIKGGAIVNLEPLTVLQSTPVAARTVSTEARTTNVAKVISVPSPSFTNQATASIFSATALAPISPEPVAQTLPSKVAALDTGDMIQEQAQRRADIRRRILEGEIQLEEKSLAAARAALAEAQGRSADIRTMRSGYAETAGAVTAQKPLISPLVRSAIERHFERVRSLQDEVTKHESNVAALREELLSRKS